MPAAPMSHNVRLPRAKTLWHLPRQAASPGTTRAVYARILTAANTGCVTKRGARRTEVNLAVRERDTARGLSRKEDHSGIQHADAR